MKRGYDRTLRIGDLIHKTLAQLISQEMHNERFQFVTVTGVTLSRDLKHAKVYVSVLSEDETEIDETVAALNLASKLLRYRLAQAVHLRVIPELKFIYDASIAQGFHITNLINNTTKK